MFPELSIWLCRRNSLKSPEPLNGDMDQVDGGRSVSHCGWNAFIITRELCQILAKNSLLCVLWRNFASSLLFARPKEIIILMDWTVNKDQYPIYAKQFLAAGQVDGCGRLWDEVEGQRPKIIGAIGKVNKKADNGRVVTMRMRINFIALSASQSIPNNNEEGSN